MGTVFGTSNEDYGRGCFRRFTLDTSSGKGARLMWADQSMSLPFISKDTEAVTSKNPTNDWTTADFVVVGFTFHKAESLAMVKCFNDASFIYAFGDSIDSSTMSVKLIGSLYKADRMMNSVWDFYSKSRVSQKTDSPLILTWGGSKALKGYLINMESNTADNRYRMQNIDLTLILAGFD